MQSNSDAKTNSIKQIGIRSVMNLYGAFLFSGLLLSIYAHEIKDVGGFLLFLLISSVLYFLLWNLYFKSERWKKMVFITLCFIALFSLFMVFFTAA